ncbi:MAG TPA: polymer-forming cytoskeletal protein [Thermoanaerobaculia bacterium]|jgi:cytoskeletal protein CcmA (bactofilin family)
MNQDRRITDDAGADATVVGKGIRIKGEISGSATIQVWGTIEGKANTDGLVWVREGGEVSGEITAANVVVEGQVEGKIDAAEMLELRAASRVKGDVSAKALAVADGSYFQGRVQMKEGGEPPIRFQEKRQS